MKRIAPSINYHLTKSCNMRCKFCFATFKDLGFVKHNLQQSKRLIESIATAGFEKITFAGGEPTLVKELPQLLKLAKQQGLVTTIVTNGLKLSQPELFKDIAQYTDWIALSVDSIQVDTNLQSGRALVGRTALTERYYLDIIEKIHKQNIKLKINTVVSSYNNNEDMSDFILKAKPDRWKVLQALSIEGQNSTKADEFTISSTQFQQFIKRNKLPKNEIKLIVENNSLIKGSYVMVSPEGKFINDSKSYHQYSDSILDVGVTKALEQIDFKYSKFLERGGMYNWKNEKNEKI
jgi:radical S-adenosyl methionine domain-containing protein 2